MSVILLLTLSLVLLGSLQHGTCTIQPTSMAFGTEEFIDMIQRCRLNRLNRFGAFLAMQFRAAKQDPKLTSLLCILDDVLYSGMPIPREEEEYAYRSGISLRVSFLLQNFKNHA